MATVKCPVCGGSGKVSSTLYHPQPKGCMDIIMVNCRNCNGKGTIEKCFIYTPFFR